MAYNVTMESLLCCAVWVLHSGSKAHLKKQVPFLLSSGPLGSPLGVRGLLNNTDVIPISSAL